jgi:hypothetical protein
LSSSWLNLFLQSAWVEPHVLPVLTAEKDPNNCDEAVHGHWDRSLTTALQDKGTSVSSWNGKSLRDFWRENSRNEKRLARRRSTDCWMLLLLSVTRPGQNIADFQFPIADLIGNSANEIRQFP